MIRTLVIVVSVVLAGIAGAAPADEAVIDPSRANDQEDDRIASLPGVHEGSGESGGAPEGTTSAAWAEASAGLESDEERAQLRLLTATCRWE